MNNLKSYFISATKKYSTLYNYVNAPYIRKLFNVNNFSSAEICICGLGFYELYLNGEKITKGKLSPYISNPDHIAYYDKYDISSIIKTGKNTIGIILGNGFLNNIGGYPWGFDKATFRSAPKVSFIVYIDGKEFIHSDEFCRVAPSPIYFDDLRCGEYYDSRLEQPGWNLSDFNDSQWKSAIKTKPPKGELKFCKVAPVKVIKELSPVSIFTSDGGTIFDFGVNMAGICRFSFKGENGCKIILNHCEALAEGRCFYNKNTCTPDFDRSMSQKDIFICNGKENVYEPSFTYHGFRYVFVEGIEKKHLNDFKLTMLALSSDFGRTGDFDCSDETINKLQNITLNSDISNLIHIPTDCPQREKNGWTADAALSCEQFLYNFNCADNLKIWLDNIRKAQLKNGQLPGVIPTVQFGYEWGNGPAWDNVLIELPYTIYRFTNDLSVLTDNAAAIAKYLRYLNSMINEDGLLSFGLPDWCESGSPSEGLCSTPLEITDSLVSIEICKKAAFIFDSINDNKNKQYALYLSNLITENFRKKHITSNLFISCFSQTAQAKAIHVGIFNNEEKPKAVKNLIKLIAEKNNKFCVGVIGARVLFRVLADNGYADMALNLIKCDGFPSYKYWLDNGATSLWEAFNELYPNSIFRKDGGRTLSLNHHFWGDISAWFYRYILGINVNPEFDGYFEIDPAVLSKITYAKGSYIKDGNGIKITRNNDVIKIETVGNAKFRLSQKCKESFKIICDN